MIEHFKQFLASPVFKEDEEKTNRARVLNSLLVSSTLVLVFILIIDVPFFVVKKLAATTMIALALALVLFVQFLVRQGQVQRASMIFIGGGWFVFTVLVLLAGGVDNIIPIYYLVITVLAGLLLGQSIAISVRVNARAKLREVRAGMPAGIMFRVSSPPRVRIPQRRVWDTTGQSTTGFFHPQILIFNL